MAIDPSQIVLTPQQKELVAQIAEHSGKDCSVVLDEMLANATGPEVSEAQGNGSQQNGANLEGMTSVYERMNAIGAIGCVEGPGDLSTNPKHMEGFGINASRQRKASD